MYVNQPQYCLVYNESSLCFLALLVSDIASTIITGSLKIASRTLRAQIYLPTFYFVIKSNTRFDKNKRIRRVVPKFTYIIGTSYRVKVVTTQNRLSVKN